MSAVRAFVGLALALASSPLAARDLVQASQPSDVAVTIYRDPYGDFDRNDPRGFAMISETRSVTLPAGDSTIRFEGVAEGMIAVSAIVSGLPGGTIEKNRNADLLSPAALVDGTLGNRVTITRTNPATGQEESEQAIVRTRADGGIVLQTSLGYEAVRCSGLPERLNFDSIPDGLSAQPVFSIDTHDETGGTYQVTLTYLSWGFDWQAHYVTRLEKPGRRSKQNASMLSWLTLVNDNAQSFQNAELMVVAGKLNVESDFEELAKPPRGEPLRLTCWPRGNTAAGSVPDVYPNLPPPPPPSPMMNETIVVTGARVRSEMFDAAAPVAVLAGEENLGDLKLFRVPEPITVRAKGLKQVAFLKKDRVRGEMVYEAACAYWDSRNEGSFEPARLMFITENDEEHGLGVSLPRGGVTVFEPSSAGELLVGEDDIRDYPVGQEVEIQLTQSTNLFYKCTATGKTRSAREGQSEWREMRAAITNASSQSGRLRLEIGSTDNVEVQRVKGLKLRNGAHVIETRMKPGEEREITFWVRYI
ncbi:hypothetical protein [Altererythrobacter sp.]|uniref:DUF4139 domain-containing protein n=1 Tax=Altererythrobacter sp. TaxID=1872480 RepID=UPI001B1C7B7B|nr:hypothetical protein [Altererythrobacter sp.]MBO6609909.1 hypothetical protein [Altererythrobacter sp.]MBO6641673.1 hypothetical protein [Altererythrobacter sp.]MBO6707628.1 hypothetical protein [Altererythrobacter sp.]